MKKVYVILISVILIFQTFAQDISLSANRVNFGQINTDQQYTRTVYLRNFSGQPITIDSLRSFLNGLSVSASSFTVLPGDSVPVDISFTAISNFDYDGFISIETADVRYPLLIRVSAMAFYEDNYYLTTRNLFAEELKNALYNRINGHTDLGYAGARDVMFSGIDNRNGTIESVYTGQVITASNRTEAQNQGFNTEHTWPQGSFDSQLPMRSDIHHLFPCDVTSNSQRGSYPFGIVRNTSWSVGGSKLGTNSNGNIVFEPRDVHKGNAARALFYFLIRYQNAYNFYNYDGVWYPMIPAQEQLLIDWHEQDPPDLLERQRNNDIFSYQNNRNPFVDHPDFAERVIRFTGTATRTLHPELAFTPAAPDFGTVAVGDTGYFQLALLNTGETDLTIQQVQSNDPVFIPVPFSSILPKDSLLFLNLKFIPSQVNTEYAGNLLITTEAGTSNIPLQGNSLVTGLIQQSKPHSIQDALLLSVQPNPFNSLATITWSLPSPQSFQLKIFNANGRLITTVKRSNAPAGRNRFRWNATGFSSGVYFVQLTGAGYKLTRKIILLQ